MVLHPGSTSTEGPAVRPPAQPEAGGPVVTGKKELGDRDAGLRAVEAASWGGLRWGLGESLGREGPTIT